jgi:hypothetical protein
MDTETDKPKIGRPATGQMPKRYFRMNDDGWQQIESAAIASGESTSEYVRRVLLKDSVKVLKKKQET